MFAGGEFFDWRAPLVVGGFLVGFYFTLLGVLFFGGSVPSVFRRVVEGLVVFFYFVAVLFFPPILIVGFIPPLFVTFYPMYLAARHRVMSIWRLLAWLLLTSISMLAAQLVYPPTEETLFTIGFVTATGFGLLYKILLTPRRR